MKVKHTYKNEKDTHPSRSLSAIRNIQINRIYYVIVSKVLTKRNISCDKKEPQEFVYSAKHFNFQLMFGSVDWAMQMSLHTLHRNKNLFP